jgi:hypothetical protein
MSSRPVGVIHHDGDALVPEWPPFIKASGLRRRNGHEEERVAEKQVSFSADRRKNQGARPDLHLSDLKQLDKVAAGMVVQSIARRGLTSDKSPLTEPSGNGPIAQKLV